MSPGERALDDPPSQRPGGAASGAPLWAQPHHDGSALHGPGLAAASPGDRVDVWLRVPRSGSAPRAVHLRATYDGEPFLTEAVHEHDDGHDAWFRAELRVRNRLTRYRWLLDDGPAGYRWHTAAGVARHDVTDARDHALSTHPAAPDWAVDGVVYQIFPDRFARSGADHGPLPGWAVPVGWHDPVAREGRDVPRQLYGGDLAGVEARLDHVADLGATVLYLTPFFPAGSNHRYDASSFDLVDPLLGGDTALASLVAAAHRRGLRVLGDLTTNHTGRGHEWFRRAVAEPASVEAGFYYFADQPTADPDGYESWFGVPSLPKLDHGDPELRRRLVDGPDSVVARWLRPPESGGAGLDGWRIDVANMTGRRGLDDHTHEVARTVRATMTATRPDAFLLAEHFHDATADLTVGAGGWDAVMNYAGATLPLWTWLAAPGSGYRVPGLPVDLPRRSGLLAARTLQEVAAAVPWRQVTQQVNPLGSHDTPRARSVVGSDAALLAAVAFLAGYPGAPMLFAGDELGLTGDHGEHARTPMPWDDPARFGAPVHRGVRELLRLRTASEALRRGGLRWLVVADDQLAWLRETAGERVCVVLAREPGQRVLLPVSLVGDAPELLWGDAEIQAGGSQAVGPAGLLAVRLDGPGAAFLRCPVLRRPA